MKRFYSFFRNLFQKNKVERELDEELRFHLEMQTELNLKKGLPPDEARRLAMLSLGGIQQTKEGCREVRSGAFLDILFQDLRYAIRSLLRAPAYVAVILITLALGIMATTAIYSVTRAVLLRPLPFPEPDRLVAVWLREKDGTISNTNYATYKDWKEQLRSFEGIAAMGSWEPTLIGYGEPAPLEGLSVTREFFQVLGTGVFLGRNFQDQEDQPQRNRVVILTHGLWMRRFGGNRSIIGKEINLTGIPRLVVGVLPPHFESIVRYNFKEAEIFRPLGYDETLPQACRSCNHLTSIARIRRGVDLERAEKEIDSFTVALVKKYPNDYGQAGSLIVPMQEQLVGKVRKILVLLLIAVGIVLLVGCANVANLMLARATVRSREIAIRAALGASRGRLIRQLLTESSLIAFSGGALGIALSSWATNLFIRFAPGTIPRLHTATMDSGVLLFAVVVTIFCGILFGVIPAMYGSRLDLQKNLRESSRSVVADRQKARRALVIANIAMALILLTGAGLLLQTIRELLSQRLGFKSENVVTMMIGLVGAKYDEYENVHVYYRQVLDQIRSLPGVNSAGIVSQLPLSVNLDMYGVEVRDKPLANHGEAPSAERFGITEGYLKAMQIPILRGRGISDKDDAKSSPVVLVNRTFAQKIWPGEDPIGKEIHIGEKERPWRRVVGVVEDVRHRGLNEPFAMQFYMPYQQWFDNTMIITVRTENEPSSAIETIRKTILSVDPSQPISQIATMQQVVESNVAQKKFTLQLIEFFALAALFLAAIGVYGVMSYSVTSRFQEIGIRMALGARRGAVLSMILMNGLLMAGIGILIGVIGSFLSMRFIESLLFQVAPFEPAIVAAVVLILLVIAFIACSVPAIRAARLNPVLALRHE